MSAPQDVPRRSLAGPDDRTDGETERVHRMPSLWWWSDRLFEQDVRRDELTGEWTTNLKRGTPREGRTMTTAQRRQAKARKIASGE
jgi:hypothetical protein